MACLELLANFLHFFWLFLHTSGHSCTHICIHTQRVLQWKSRSFILQTHIKLILRQRFFTFLFLQSMQPLTKDWRVCVCWCIEEIGIKSNVFTPQIESPHFQIPYLSPFFSFLVRGRGEIDNMVAKKDGVTATHHQWCHGQHPRNARDTHFPDTNNISHNMLHFESQENATSLKEREGVWIWGSDCTCQSTDPIFWKALRKVPAALCRRHLSMRRGGWCWRLEVTWHFCHRIAPRRLGGLWTLKRTRVSWKKFFKKRGKGEEKISGVNSRMCKKKTKTKEKEREVFVKRAHLFYSNIPRRCDVIYFIKFCVG